MPKTESERLADHYLEAAGIAAVATSPDGNVRLIHHVTTEAPIGWTVVCCASYGDAVQLARGQALYDNMTVRDRAGKLGIGITSHDKVVARAYGAVIIVNQTIHAAQCAGEMKPINDRFKEARLENPSLRYRDFLFRHKAGMLEAMARETVR
jgi:hypothetical protein